MASRRLKMVLMVMATVLSPAMMGIGSAHASEECWVDVAPPFGKVNFADMHALIANANQAGGFDFDQDGDVESFDHNGDGQINKGDFSGMIGQFLSAWQDARAQGCAPGKVKKLLDAAGGFVKSQNGQATVEIPDGVLEDAEEISVTPLKDGPFSDWGKKRAFEFGPDGKQFKDAVYLRLSYEGMEVEDPDSLRIVTYKDGEWHPIQLIGVDKATKTVVGRTTHFSTYAVAEDAQGQYAPGGSCSGHDEPKRLPVGMYETCGLNDRGNLVAECTGSVWGEYLWTDHLVGPLNGEADHICWYRPASNEFPNNDGDPGNDVSAATGMPCSDSIPSAHKYACYDLDSCDLDDGGAACTGGGVCTLVSVDAGVDKVTVEGPGMFADAVYDATSGEYLLTERYACACPDFHESDGSSCLPSCGENNENMAHWCGLHATGCSDAEGEISCSCESGYIPDGENGKCRVREDCDGVNSNLCVVCDNGVSVTDHIYSCTTCRPGHNKATNCKTCLPGYYDYDGDGYCCSDSQRTGLNCENIVNTSAPLWVSGPEAEALGWDSAVDLDGNIIIAGAFTEPNLEIGGRSVNMGHAANLDVFVAKLTPTGEAIWLNQYVTEGQGAIFSLAVDSFNRIIIGGEIDGRLGGLQSMSQGSDAFVAQLDTDYGYVNWIRPAAHAGGGSESVTAVAVDPLDNSIVVLGSFGPVWEPIMAEPIHYEYYGMFMERWDSSGNTTDMRSFSYRHGADLEINPNTGEIYALVNTTYFGNETAAVVRFSDGFYEITNHYLSADGCYGWSLAIDLDGFVYASTRLNNSPVLFKMTPSLWDVGLFAPQSVYGWIFNGGLGVDFENNVIWAINADNWDAINVYWLSPQGPLFRSERVDVNTSREDRALSVSVTFNNNVVISGTPAAFKLIGAH